MMIGIFGGLGLSFDSIYKNLSKKGTNHQHQLTDSQVDSSNEL